MQLLKGDLVCAEKKSRVRWGRVCQPETGDGNEQDVQIMWEFNQKKSPSSCDEDLVVLDRLLKIGQTVRTKSGETAVVVDSERLTTLAVIGSDEVPLIIPDVKLSSIAPITKLFYGVMIEYEGWIGQITNTSRVAKWLVKNAGRQFSTIVRPDDSDFKRGYPYFKNRSEPYVGMTSSLHGEQTIVDTVEDITVHVVWLGRLPSHLESTRRPPPRVFYSRDIHDLKVLYINPCSYLDKFGICIYKTQSTDRILPQFIWRDEFLFGKKQDEEEISQQCDIVPKGDFHVRKLFSRHTYKLDTGEICFGNELTPLEMDHALLFPFCKSVSGAGDEYGVILGTRGDTFRIQWVKIKENGDVQELNQSELSGVIKHPIFGSLAEYRIVVKSRMAVDLGFASGFNVGNVVKIDRFSLGKLTVYCSSSGEFRSMWPHEVELFQEMSPKTRVKLNCC